MNLLLEVWTWFVRDLSGSQYDDKTHISFALAQHDGLLRDLAEHDEVPE